MKRAAKTYGDATMSISEVGYGRRMPPYKNTRPTSTGRVFSNVAHDERSGQTSIMTVPWPLIHTSNSLRGTPDWRMID